MGGAERSEAIFRAVLHRKRSFGGHAAEASEAGAAKEVQDEGFSVVIGVVRHGNGVEAMLDGNAREPTVAQFACSHLDADAMLCGVGRCVEIGTEKLNSLILSPLLHELRIRVALGSAEMEVAVRHGVLPACTAEHVSHAHGVYASAHRKQDFHYLASRRRLGLRV